MTTSWWVPALVGGVLVAGYLLGLRRRPASLPPWPTGRTVAWTTGALLVALALSPPLRELAHHDPRAHMAQHLLLGMYAPVGLVLGAPVTLFLGSASRRAQLSLASVLRSRPVHVLSHPVLAALLSVGGLFVLYLTPLYARSLVRQDVHWLLLAHLLLAGYLYTWAIAGPDPAPRRPGIVTRTVVLVAAAGAHAFLAKLLYARASDGWAVHGDASTSAAAAWWMYYGGDVAELLLAGMLFGWWYRQAEVLSWHVVADPEGNESCLLSSPVEEATTNGPSLGP